MVEATPKIRRVAWWVLGFEFVVVEYWVAEREGIEFRLAETRREGYK